MTSKLHAIQSDHIDPDAIKVVRRLNRYGFQAYFVGGCVRDLLLGRKPKDFDLATSATPDELRRLFRNCRIIGRRFRLAHIFFGRKNIETATFRKAPTPENDGEPLIWRDNEFGTAEEDALRRDFTINGLFFDLATGEVIDVVGGVDDLCAGIVRTIGDPNVRLPEDPVRILRAVKFASRLDFKIDKATHDAMVCHRGLIANCSSARVLEEIYRLLRSGYAHPSFVHLHNLGILPVLFPEVAALLPQPENTAAQQPVVPLRVHTPRHNVKTASDAEDNAAADDLTENESVDEDRECTECAEDSAEQTVESVLANEAERLSALFESVQLTEMRALKEIEEQIWSHLRALDERVHQKHDSPTEPLLLGALLAPLARVALADDCRIGNAIDQIEHLVKAVARRINVSRKHRERLKQILVGQKRLVHRRRRHNVRHRDYYTEAYELLELRHKANGEPMPNSDEQPPHRSRRRRRRRRKTPIVSN